MDPKELRGLYEAYSEVYAPQQIDELSVNKMHAYINKAEKDRDRLNKKWDQGTATPKERKKVFDREEGEARASEKIRQKTGKDSFRLNALDKLKSAITKEEFDIFDTVLEFLQAEGYAETLEEAEWLMANVIDEEAIDIILGEGHGSRRSFKTQSADERRRVKTFRPDFYTPHKNYDPEANRGQGQILRPNQAEKQRRKALAKSAMSKEEFELWINSLVEEGYDLSDYTWNEMYEFYLDEAEKPFPYEKVTAQQKKHTAAGRYGNMIKMGMAKRRAKEAEKTGGSQQTAGAGWYHAKEDYVNEAITSEKGKAKAAQMIADRSTSSGRAKSGQGGNVAMIKHIGRANVDKYMGTPPNPKIAKNPVRSNFSGLPAQGSGNKAARRAAALKNEEYMDEAQEARNNPEKYEREQSKKSAPVRGERTPMPPRGDKRREDFEKWYAANVR